MPTSDSTSLFFTLSLLAMFGYSLQSTLMTAFYRKIDRLSAVAYRGLSLGMTMLPLLFFVPVADIALDRTFFANIIGASLAAALGNWCAANAYSHLPVGLASALSMSFATIAASSIGYLVFGEDLSLPQTILVVLLLLTIVALGKAKSKGSLPDEFHPIKGILNSLFFGIFIGSAYCLVASASRTHHPFLVGYCWELTIGIFAVLICMIRQLANNTPLQRITRDQFVKLALYSSPTAIGTGAYAFATTLGPVGIATAIVSTLMVSNTLLAKIIYGETPTGKQWFLLLLTCLQVGILRYVTT